MKDLLREYLSGAGSMPEVFQIALPLLRRISEERNGLIYVSGRWDPPWGSVDPRYNSRLEINTRRVQSHTGVTSINDGHILGEDVCQRIAGTKVPDEDELIRFRRLLLLGGGVTQVVVMPGWSRFTQTNALVASLPEYLSTTYAKFDDDLFKPLPEELT